MSKAENPAAGTATLQRGANVRIFPDWRNGVWHNRNYLPHFESAVAIQHVTFHLADSIPKSSLERINAEVESLSIEHQKVARRKKLEEWMDAGHGQCLLKNEKVAQTVQSSLLHFDNQRYCLLAWVIMPNHVHVLFEPIAPWTMARIIASWKSFTGRKIAELVPSPSLNPSQGQIVWRREYWDRFIRNERHLRQAIEYIHENPVKAGLVKTPADWPWSSASHPGTATLQRGANPESAK